jgi:hypothetical protein
VTSTSIQRAPSAGARSPAADAARPDASRRGTLRPATSGQPRTVVRAAVVPSATAVSSAPAVAGAFASSSAAPAGIDAELWSVLNADERAFFGRAQLTTAPTYARGGGASAPARAAVRRGLHVDVRA